MANVNQIYEILNSASKQAFGESAVVVTDTSSFIALGSAVLRSDTDTENYLNTLVDRIGKTVFSVRNYQKFDEYVIKQPFEFGAILQKIYVEMPTAKQNNAWEIGKVDYKPEFAPVIKPNVKQKLFNNISTWEIDVTIPDTMLKTAFTSETTMSAFISAIFVAMENAMVIKLENAVDLTRSSFIARKIKANKPCGAINLLKQYNTLTTKGLTVPECLMDAEFLKWSSAEINKWVRRISRMSTLFNDEGYQRHTPRENLVVDVLQDYSSATTAFLQSNTYHAEMVSLPMYHEVPYWQGSGDNYSFESTSSINIKLDETNTVNKSGIIACIYDEQALGVTINERKTTSERNNKDEYTDYFNKANMGYFNDMSENGIVFYLEETV